MSLMSKLRSIRGWIFSITREVKTPKANVRCQVLPGRNRGYRIPKGRKRKMLPRFSALKSRKKSSLKS